MQRCLTGTRTYEPSNSRCNGVVGLCTSVRGTALFLLHDGLVYCRLASRTRGQHRLAQTGTAARASLTRNSPWHFNSGCMVVRSLICCWDSGIGESDAEVMTASHWRYLCNMTPICTPPSQLVHTTSRRFCSGWLRLGSASSQSLARSCQLQPTNPEKAPFSVLSRNWNTFQCTASTTKKSIENWSLAIWKCSHLHGKEGFEGLP